MSDDLIEVYRKRLAYASTLPRMTWIEAVAAMKDGKAVRRIEDMKFSVEPCPGSDPAGGEKMICSGASAIRLNVAVTADGQFVSVFAESHSRRSAVMLFEPTDEMMGAADWVVLEDERMWA